MDQGAEPGALAIGGDSAGGGLTIAMLVTLKDVGVPLPACGVVLSPSVDLEEGKDKRFLFADRNMAKVQWHVI